jgi:uncharacterized phosphosugar-binding protein
MSAYDSYVRVIEAQTRQIATTQRAAIELAGQWVAEALARQRFLFAFGTGHSHMIAEEIFYRAGGLVRAIPMLEEPLMLHEHAVDSTWKEREAGYAERILARYPVDAGDVVVIASNGGRNAVPIELALGARARGAKTVALTNRAQSFAWPSRHPSGLRLAEVTDVVIDNCGVNGDATLQVAGIPTPVGPTSSITGFYAINLIILSAMEIAARQGTPPDVYVSSNTSGDEHNAQLIAGLRSSNPHL